MDGVFVRVRWQAKGVYHKILSEVKLYLPLDLKKESCYPYDPCTNLSESEWFYIENFKNTEFCPEFLKGKFDSKKINQMETGLFSSVDFLFSYQEKRFYFQKISKGAFLEKKTISFGENVTLESKNNRLIVNDEPDALYCPEKDLLFFRKISKVSSFFKGMEILYREATNEEVGDFLNNKFIATSEGFCAEKVSVMNRKRIALVSEKISRMDNGELDSWLRYIKEYYSFDVVDGGVKIKSDNELKYLLYGFMEKFYTKKFSNEKVLANSTVKLN